MCWSCWVLFVVAVVAVVAFVCDVVSGVLVAEVVLVVRAVWCVERGIVVELLRGLGPQQGQYCGGRGAELDLDPGLGDVGERKRGGRGARRPGEQLDGGGTGRAHPGELDRPVGAGDRQQSAARPAEMAWQGQRPPDTRVGGLWGVRGGHPRGGGRLSFG